MKHIESVESYEAMRRAFRDLTDVEADGAATRARVLAGAGRNSARRERLRRLGVPIAAALIASGSVSAALAVARHWRAPTPTAIAPTADAEGATHAHPSDDRAVQVIPVRKIATSAAIDETAAIPRRPRPLAPGVDAETRAYARAHRAHFTDDMPARALEAWDAYLAAFPHGAFAPEAAYNRAICLVRLDRRAEAARALHRFAGAPPGSYRREEALRLLDWLGDTEAR